MGLKEIILISIVLEFLEVYLQYNSTMKETVYKLYKYYNTSPFLFFATHLDYIFILFISMYYGNLSWAIILAIALKTFDIFTKLELIKKLFLKPDIEYISSMASVLDMKIPFWVYFIGALTYPYLIYLALST